MGRRLTTGRFDTREELIERVLHLYHHTDNKAAQIARHCRVSPGVVSSIVGAHPRPTEGGTTGAKASADKALRDPAPRRKDAPIEGLWVQCFQRVEGVGLGPPYQGQIVEDLRSRLRLKVGRKEVTVNRAACSTTPYKTRKKD